MRYSRLYVMPSGLWWWLRSEIVEVAVRPIGLWVISAGAPSDLLSLLPPTDGLILPKICNLDVRLDCEMCARNADLFHCCRISLPCGTANCAPWHVPAERDGWNLTRLRRHGRHPYHLCRQSFLCHSTSRCSCVSLVDSCLTSDCPAASYGPVSANGGATCAL